jgi:hypothetical protein
VLATLPNIQVAAGDLIVVHFAPAVTVTSELTTKGDCTDAGCYPGAWDVAGGTTGITFSNRVLSVINPAGSIVDTVAFVKGTTASPVGFPADVQTQQAAGAWMPADCSGALCTYTSTPTVNSIAVDWTTAGTTAAGVSMSRTNGANTKTSADWTATATSSFGAANP